MTPRPREKGAIKRFKREKREVLAMRDAKGLKSDTIESEAPPHIRPKCALCGENWQTVSRVFRISNILIMLSENYCLGCAGTKIKTELLSGRPILRENGSFPSG